MIKILVILINNFLLSYFIGGAFKVIIDNTNLFF